MNMNGKFIKGTLLVAGTTIGGGVLGLPVLTNQAGFFPSLGIYIACWLFMASTGLLFLEIALWMKDEANIVSMAERTLGTGGKVIAWALYLFLFYCLTLAYIVGIGNLLVEALQGAVSLTNGQGQLLFLLIATPLIYIGTKVIGRLNIPLMIGLGLSYLTFIFLGYQHVNFDYLMRMEWSQVWIALPICFVAFAYHGIIPTLVHYMERDVKQIRGAILIGSFLPLITYVIWQWLILGIIPAHGPGSLMEALEHGENAIQPLRNILNIPNLYIVGQFFAFFALITSFFGVTLGLMDFLADGLKIEKKGIKKVLLCLLVIVPPLLIAISYPHLFLTALGYAGGFGSALLLGLLPIIMVWRGRYHLGLKNEYQAAGGKPFLILLAAFVLIELCCEIILTLNKIK